MGSRRCSVGVGAGTKTGNELANTSIDNNENEQAAAQDPKLESYSKSPNFVTCFIAAILGKLCRDYLTKKVVKNGVSSSSAKR